MGGCYDSRYESRVYTPPRDTVQELLQQFYNSGEQKLLFDAYRAYMQSNNAGFIRKIVAVSGSGIQKEFGEYELEAKLELHFEDVIERRAAASAASEGKTPLVEIMDTFEFLTSPTARFLKDASNKESSGINHFFGTADGEERLVVIEKGGKLYMKEKGARELYGYGVPGEELVMKRRETRIETNPLEVAKTIVEKYGDGKTLYQGSLTKDRAEAYLLQTNTGRIYSLTVDELLRKDGEKLLQFEAEYAGYVPRFTAFRKDDEPAVVEDLVQILKQVVFLYNGIELRTGQKLIIQPTQERKFDFVSGERKFLSLRFELASRQELTDQKNLPLLIPASKELVALKRKRKR